jgi:hypothetical protein
MGEGGPVRPGMERERGVGPTLSGDVACSEGEGRRQPHGSRGRESDTWEGWSVGCRACYWVGGLGWPKKNTDTF